ncbi:MAG: cyclic nucleotide-binding domain-containing protein [Alphaproteobacteria bacterium]|nr:cyclic nucleotide-binding domain-containing protein [Alphaproteobacteria bacterium]
MTKQKSNGTHTVILERCFAPKGSVIIKQGDSANCAYLIQSGKVSIYRESNGNIVELAELGTGQIIGEMALLAKEDIRSAGVKALEDCNLILITRQTFLEKLSRTDATIKAIMTMLSQRLVSLNHEFADERGSTEELAKAAENICKNAMSKIKDPKKEKEFQKNVKAKLDSFLKSLKAFEENS